MIELEERGPVTLLRLVRGKGNALNLDLINATDEALQTLERNATRAVVLTGQGSVFGAGVDLPEMAAGGEAYIRQFVPRMNQVFERLATFPKPLVAAVNGPAVAGGAGLVLACDIVLAVGTATFGFPEPRRGIVAGLVAPLFAFRIGAGHAARLLLTAEPIHSAEAHRIGVFHEIVPEDHLWPRAQEIAGQCARCAPEALQLTKKMLNETIGEHLFTLLAAGAATSATSRTTEAALEGLAAFVEKREPKWK